MPQEIGDGVFVARIDGFHHFQQIFIDVAVMGDLRLVDFLIRARFDLPADVGDGRRGQVVAGFAGQDFCLQCFVAVVIIGTRLDAGFFFKGGDGFGIDIIRPVVDIEFARLFGFGLGGGGLGGGIVSAAARSQGEAQDCRRHQCFFHGFRPFVQK